MEKDFISGALPDTRSVEEISKDYQFKELVASANPVNWVEKTPDQWRKFPIFNQDGSGSCVAQTQAKEMGVMRWLKDKVYVHFSATDIYQQRANKPAAGMGSYDVRNIARNKGATLEALAPSQELSDAQMDSAVIEDYKRQVGAVFKVPNSVDLPVGDIETVASFIQTTGKAVMVWFYFKYDEWTDHPEIKHPDLSSAASDTIRHSVTAVDFALVNGKKCLIIEDSWGPQYGLNGQRVIDEDFFKVRNYFAGYLVNFQFETGNQKPQYTFNKDLFFDMTDPDVVGLQNCLKWEGLFPSNADSTGYFGAITKSAVIKFQTKYGINPIGRVGPTTRAKLNQLFS